MTPHFEEAMVADEEEKKSENSEEVPFSLGSSSIDGKYRIIRRFSEDT
jgi:hypothetical protein